MNFVADLHIHSRFSMATSKALNVPHLAAWASRKGIDLVGTGDFTHPKWREELRENLVYDDESGLYLPLKKEVDFEAPRQEGHPAKGPYFCLQTEISSIYKKGGKTRKVHNLVFMPTLEAADRFSRRLGLLGNINSDGRPILGLDSRDLLEIVLETSEEAVLIPAHIWTPWFSLFGSKSGFDSIDECYGDLTKHIFALETGLSSDPAMNRHLSTLDNFALISNSDAHSGPNLGREANLFYGAPSYAGMFRALRAASNREQTGLDCKFMGTLEFYPEEGKYHLDGHRACGVVVDPANAAELREICPVCGKPLTIGVLRRVMELADRREPGEVLGDVETRMLVPLPEVLAEIMGAGANSRKVQSRYAQILAELGAELDVLCRVPESDIRRYWEPLGEAVSRIRAGNVIVQPGFDGQYGLIKVFDEDEIASVRSGNAGILPGAVKREKVSTSGRTALKLAPKVPKKMEAKDLPRFSPAQREAIEMGGPLMVLAGPGSGKTRVLVGRVLHLLEKGEDPEKILAITFTRKAAEEMRGRLSEQLSSRARLPECDTLHGLAWNLLRQAAKNSEQKTFLLNEAAALRLFNEANPAMKARERRELWRQIGMRHEQNLPLEGNALAAWKSYEAKKSGENIKYLDYHDLLAWLMEHASQLQGRWQHVLVDEAQDLSPLQLDIVAGLTDKGGSGFFGIGDPDQAIYDFRGASGQTASDFKKIWPDLRILQLGESYRASQKILDMAANVLDGGQCGHLLAANPAMADLRIFSAENDRLEAVWIAGKIKQLIGSTAHTLLDSSREASPILPSLAPEDIAILTRLKAQMAPIARELEKAGIPFSMPAREEFWEDELCASFLELAPNTSMSPQDFLRGLASSDAAWKQLEKSPAFATLCALWRECGGWEAFWQRLGWLTEAEMISAKGRNVQLLTIHASKGLEFQAVFMPGMENGLLPMKSGLIFDGSAMADATIEAEKRLLYVGLTRASRAIFLSHARKRRLYGQELVLDPSPFLDMVRDFCVKSKMGLRTRKVESNLSLFQ